jgi:hypothetical protein
VQLDYDAGKQIKERKRCITVDTLGLVLSVFVTAASQTEREAARARRETRRKERTKQRDKTLPLHGVLALVNYV